MKRDISQHNNFSGREATIIQTILTTREARITDPTRLKKKDNNNNRHEVSNSEFGFYPFFIFYVGRKPLNGQLSQKMISRSMSAKLELHTFVIIEPSQAKIWAKVIYL